MSEEEVDALVAARGGVGLVPVGVARDGGGATEFIEHQRHARQHYGTAACAIGKIFSVLGDVEGKRQRTVALRGNRVMSIGVDSRRPW